jgi:hypothetical protein
MCLTPSVPDPTPALPKSNKDLGRVPGGRVGQVWHLPYNGFVNS